MDRCAVLGLKTVSVEEVDSRQIEVEIKRQQSLDGIHLTLITQRQLEWITDHKGLLVVLTL